MASTLIVMASNLHYAPLLFPAFSMISATRLGGTTNPKLRKTFAKPIVTTSKALVTRSNALVLNSRLFLRKTQ